MLSPSRSLGWREENRTRARPAPAGGDVGGGTLADSLTHSATVTIQLLFYTLNQNRRTAGRKAKQFPLQQNFTSSLPEGSVLEDRCPLRRRPWRAAAEIEEFAGSEFLERDASSPPANLNIRGLPQREATGIYLKSRGKVSLRSVRKQRRAVLVRKEGGPGHQQKKVGVFIHWRRIN